MYPVLGWADFPYYYAPIQPRPMHAANMMLEVKRWLQKTMPWWDRRGGRDHIWLMPHDEGEPARNNGCERAAGLCLRRHAYPTLI